MPTARHAGPLFVLAYDHRAVLRQMFGRPDENPHAQRERFVDTKNLALDALERAAELGVERGQLGLLMDEEYGADTVRLAKTAGFTLSMPVERSRTPFFELEYGDEFGKHVESFDPDIVKALVFYNPDGDPTTNASQAADLRAVSEWTAANDRTFMLEILVPATPAQLEAAGSDEQYDRTLRGPAMARTIAELQSAGVEPAMWKVEGLDDPEHCAAVTEQARAGGREHVTCTVLGRGAGQEQVEVWLRSAAATPGYSGFAIGRTIWEEPFAAYLDGDADREQTIDRIAASLAHYVDVYTAAQV